MNHFCLTIIQSQLVSSSPGSDVLETVVHPKNGVVAINWICIHLGIVSIKEFMARIMSWMGAILFQTDNVTVAAYIN